MHAGGRRPPKPSSEARAGALPLLPPLSRAGGGGKSIMCGNTIPVRSKRSLREGQRSHPQEPPSEWYQGGTRVARGTALY